MLDLRNANSLKSSISLDKIYDKHCRQGYLPKNNTILWLVDELRVARKEARKYADLVEDFQSEQPNNIEHFITLPWE